MSGKGKKQAGGLRKKAKMRSGSERRVFSPTDETGATECFISVSQKTLGGEKKGGRQKGGRTQRRIGNWGDENWEAKKSTKELGVKRRTARSRRSSMKIATKLSLRDKTCQGLNLERWGDLGVRAWAALLQL